MAPMKFEENIKEQLESRRIEPTAAAWDRITSKLDDAQGKKRSVLFLWSAIAASFVGGALIALLVFINTPETTTSPLVSTPEAVEPEDQEEVTQEQPQSVIDTPLKEAVVTTQATEASSSKTGNRKKERVSNGSVDAILKAAASKQPQEQTTAIVQNIQKEERPQSRLDLRKLSLEQTSDPLVAQEETSSIDQEVEALLQKARKNLPGGQSAGPGQGVQMDATALLLDVEAEVDPATFKDKVFDMLSEGFTVARDAVVYRNN